MFPITSHCTFVFQSYVYFQSLPSVSSLQDQSRPCLTHDRMLTTEALISKGHPAKYWREFSSFTESKICFSYRFPGLEAQIKEFRISVASSVNINPSLYFRTPIRHQKLIELSKSEYIPPYSQRYSNLARSAFQISFKGRLNCFLMVGFKMTLQGKSLVLSPHMQLTGNFYPIQINVIGIGIAISEGDTLNKTTPITVAINIRATINFQLDFELLLH